MSTLNVSKIQHESGAGDNINLDPSGNVEVAGNLEVGGTSDLNGNVDVAGNIVASGDVQMASLNSGPLAGFRNQIINGRFAVHQRGTSFTAPDGYTCDRWYMGNAAGRNVDFVNEGPSMSALRVTNNATDNVFLRQGIELGEGCGPFVDGTIWTLSLWSDNDGWAGRVAGVAFRDAGKMLDASGQIGLTASSFVATGRTSGLYKQYALQITVDKSPAATNEMLFIGLSLPSGGMRITQVQLEPGSICTEFEHRPIATELALCQRYYQKLTGPQYTKLGMVIGNTTSGFILFSSAASLRATPSVVIDDLVTIMKGRPVTQTAFSGVNISSNTIAVDFNDNFNLNLTECDFVQTSASGGYISFEAEL